MKGLQSIADKSKSIVQGDRSTWLPLYYSFATDTAYTKDGDGRYFVTDLINACSKDDIKSAIERWKSI